ncbi:TRAP transporter small permease [Chryseomicrobium aureum]|uniref:TRAP transporter small permease n=1 Tax=Chryseomicrobium aureum TaxID=1441723 RepID=UPI00370DD6AC
MKKIFYKWSEGLLTSLIILIFIAMTVIVFSQVVLRYGFGMNISWADEFSRFSMVWLAFLGAAVGIKYSEHTRIDFFINLLPLKGRVIIEIINKIIMIIFMLIISLYTILTLENSLKLMTPALQIPTGLIQLIIPFSGIVMIIYLIIQIVDLIKYGIAKEEIV